MNRIQAGRHLIAIMLATLFVSVAYGGVYSPPVAFEHPTRVLWGDTHLHTNLSADAFTMGNQELGPEQAYRFARGEVVTAQNGVKGRLARPLDFLMVSDHAEFLGAFPLIFGRSADMAATKLGKRWTGYLEADTAYRIIMEFSMLAMGIGRAEELGQYVDEEHGVDMELLRSLNGLEMDAEISRQVWSKVGEVADKYNDPGVFTAFVGYEWSSTPDANNLHRNVLFREGADFTSQILPFSAVDSNDPEDLWRFLADYEELTGGRVLAIPHNGNLSNGLMFAERTLSGDALDADYAVKRARWEPVIEITQAKGDSETHPFLSPQDEFADYETWDKANLFATALKSNDMLQYEYARSALKNGLGLQEALGVNPFQFGFIGSTDSHNALATADEDNFFGKAGRSQPAPGRSALSFTPSEYGTNIELLNWELAGSGYAAVWAKENTRAAIFDAIKRRETYATTGPRMTLRFFGGWQFAAADVLRSDFTEHGYKRGVPMGGVLPVRAATKFNGEPPAFMVAVQKDPLGAHLDRVQIVKGWTGTEGQLKERVYDVAVSEGRLLSDGSVAPVGNTVDLQTATYRNSIGALELATVWYDPEFNPDQAAFYYVRVLEIPTPRWTTYDEVVFEEQAPDGAPEYTQERAYSSPIWYNPPSK